LLELSLDLVDSGVQRFEALLEVERDHELIDITTLFSLFGLVLDSVEVLV